MTTQTHGIFLRASVRRFSLLLLGLLAGHLLAATDPAIKSFNIPAGMAEKTLKQFSAQSGVELVFSPDQVRGIPTGMVRGDFQPVEALEKLLAGTPLTVIRDEKPGAFAIRREESNHPNVPRVAQNPSDHPEKQPTEEAQAVKLDTFRVTGSNIKRSDQEKVLPVTVMNQEAIDARLASTPIELLTALPEVVNVPLNESEINGSGARGDNASVNLRGIGSGNTLVLLNGRRIVTQSESSFAEGSFSASPNVNMLPGAGVQQVEVLRDGASSIYGTDAVAGVINYVMRDNFKGTRLELKYGLNEKGLDAFSESTLTYGVNTPNDRGNLMVVLNLYHRDESRVSVYYPSTDKSAQAPAPWNDPNVNAGFFASMSTGYFGQFQVGTVDPNTGPQHWLFTPGRPAGVPASMAAANGTFFLVPNANGTISFKNATPSRTGTESGYYLNTNVTDGLLPATNRLNLYSKFNYRLSDLVSAYIELGGYQAKSVGHRPNEGVANGTDGTQIVPVDSPWNPFGSRFWDPAGAPNADGTPRLTGTPSAVNVFARRFEDLGAKRYDITTQEYRALAGLRGRWGESWTWDSGLLHTQARTTDDERYLIRSSLLQQNLNNTSATAEYNPFGWTFAVQNGALVAVAPFKNPDSIITEFAKNFRRDGRTSLDSADFRATGPLGSLWGNEVSLAVGGEFRRETYDDVREPFAGLTPPGYPMARDFVKLNDFNSNSPNADTHASRTITGVYAETVVPLATRANRIPLLQLLEVSAAVRHDRYNDFGGVTKPKFGLTWRPFPGVMFRGSYNEGFRAPNMAIYYAGDFYRGGFGDLYRFPVTKLITDNSNILIKYAGNHTLRPETSTGTNFGVVVDVPKVKGLSLSADLWRIKQENVIQLSNGFVQDNNILLAAVQKAVAGGTPADQVDLGSGTSNYKGSPLVTRAPVTAQDIALFAAYNANLPANSQLAPVGAIVSMRGTFDNVASAFASGADFGAEWKVPAFSWGRFNLATNWTYLAKSYTQLSPTSPIAQRVSEDGQSRWRGNAIATFRSGHWTLGWSSYFYGKYNSTLATTNEATWNALGQPGYIAKVFSSGVNSYQYVVSSAVFHNAYVRYAFPGKNSIFTKNVTLQLSVNDVLGDLPPLTPDPRGYNPTVYSTQAEGRAWTLSVTKDF